MNDFMKKLIVLFIINFFAISVNAGIPEYGEVPRIRNLRTYCKSTINIAKKYGLTKSNVKDTWIDVVDNVWSINLVADGNSEDKTLILSVNPVDEPLTTCVVASSKYFKPKSD
jgi:hypothetical protein